MILYAFNAGKYRRTEISLFVSPGQSSASQTVPVRLSMYAYINDWGVKVNSLFDVSALARGD